MKNGDIPAYPESVGVTPDPYFSGGLTKREAFAMAAMQGLLANPGPGLYLPGEKSLYQMAVEHADELLDQLEKTDH